MRGLTLFLMLFVNDLYADGVPGWLTHRPAGFDGMGLADWVFPGFLFMVGMAVPFAIQNRIKKGDSNFRLVYHIFVRTGSLLIIGVLMLNVNLINPELTGMSKYLWAILVYLCIFLIWNLYGKLEKKYVIALKIVGVIGLIVLVAFFKGGTVEEPTWLKTSWWGILGLIGWGYLVTSLVYLVLKDNLFGTSMVWLGFAGINILSQLDLLDFVDFLNPVFGVIIGGNVPSIVMAGLFFSLILRASIKTDHNRFILTGAILGILIMTIGFALRNWFIISKIMGTPSWAMVCNGISILLFIFLFLIIDVWGKKKWTAVLKPAGQNSLTTYLAPNVLYYAIWWTGIPILIYKQSDFEIVVVVGSVLWALLMIGFAAILSKIGIRLKL
jgi:predicted acyltransferase